MSTKMDQENVDRMFRSAALSLPPAESPNIIIQVSLAMADLLVICTAVPEAIVAHHAGRRWLFGSAGCAIFVFLNFLGINAGSLSIMTFTFERYIAVCRPLLAYRLCTIERTKKIICGAWIIVILYCCPWFFLTELKLESERQQCKFRMSRDQYSAFFIVDFVAFYALPLTTALICYIKIAKAMEKRLTDSSGGGSFRQNSGAESKSETLPLQVAQANHAPPYNSSKVPSHLAASNTSAHRMLVVIVVLFAISWCPFRFLLIYNSFVPTSWLDIWFLFFAKTLIYLNCAVNPIVYNIMSDRFRRAARHTICWCCVEARRSGKGFESRTSIRMTISHGTHASMEYRNQEASC